MDSYVKAEDTYKWFMEESQKLIKGASEFLIQGIEIDWPIVTLAGDYYIDGGKWKISDSAYFKSTIRDRETIMENTYRVLLTRSRKGMFIYIPDHRDMLETVSWFKEMINIEAEEKSGVLQREQYWGIAFENRRTGIIPEASTASFFSTHFAY